MVVRAGGKGERWHKALDTEEDGGEEGRREETKVNIKTGGERGREEDNIFTLIHILTSTMENRQTQAVLQSSPEVDRTTEEGDIR